MYDQRENQDSMTGLIDEGMKAAHGPALWTYNNAVFTEDDFQNIVKLSGATKENQTSKIGRFGLGFNAVYNITDIPSFLSRQYIAIFDPHTTHLGRAIMDKRKPGIKLDIQKDKNMIETLSNQFKPFHGIFGCDLASDNNYNGTLFRFPLRTVEQAKVSEISNKHYDHTEIVKLLRLLANSAESLLLFTQNILKVTVYHLDRNARDGSEARPLFTITRKLIEIMRKIDPKPVLSDVATQSPVTKQSLLHQTNILNAMRNNPQRPVESSILMEVEVESTSLAQDPAFLIVPNTGKKHYQWAISSCSGTDVALEKASKEPSRLVAVGGVAIPVKIQTNGLLSVHPASNGTTFCFMPLPITTPGLPVNINGYFAVHSSRRHLYQGTSDDIDDTRSLWNEALAVDPICKAYLNLLQDLTTKVNPSEFSLQTMLPNMRLDQTEPVPKKLTMTLLQSIIQNPVKIFSNGERYASFSQVRYLQPEFRGCAIGKLAHKVFCQLSQAVIVDMPKQLIDCFQDEIVGCRKEVQDKMYDKKRFYSEIFLPSIQFVDAKERNDLICDALRDGSLDDILKEVACIPITGSGELRKASELIHPESKAAKLYGEEDSRFPLLSGVYVLQALERLGMRREVPWEDVLERARSVAQLDGTKALKRCQALVEYMQYKLRARYPGQNNCSDHIRDMIRMTPFIPPMKQPSHITLPWKESDAALLSPQDLYLEDRKMLVCAVVPLVERSIIRSEYSHTEVATFLGLKGKTVTSEQLINQLRAIKTSIEDKPNASVFRHSDIETSVRAVYEELQKKCLTDISFSETFAAIFQNEPLLYFDGAFRDVNKCAFDALGRCEPQLFTIPRSDAYRFRQLFSTIGVKERFMCDDYTKALQRMKEEYQNEPLAKDLLQLAVNILTYTCASVERENIDIENENLQEKVFIPDTNGVLQKCSEMSFNNCPWIEASDELKLTHSSVAHQLAKMLHMKTIREDLLYKNSDDFGDDFSQKERLTNRLRRILEGYPKDITILKELLQNADDAEATEIHFILDERQHGTDRVFEDKWKPLQGPALCVYNNRPFTNEDLQGIINLGEGSKGKDPNKTGQYGVGFNCVYNITDAPMFLTKGKEVGETLCVFDPQCQYIPTKSNTTSHGRKFPRKPDRDLGNLRKQFPDVFTGFPENIVDIDNGTLFRFPLRQKRSIIGDSVDQKEIRLLFSQFQNELPECLLFLAHLRKVTLSRIDGSGKPKMLYSVESKHSHKEDSQNHEIFSQHLRTISSKLRSREIAIDRVKDKNIMYSIQIEDSQGVCKNYRVGQQIGFNIQQQVPRSISDACKEGHLALLPRGGIAILTEQFNIHTSKRIPKTDCKSRMFCFLPLPVSPNLPYGVHINGHFVLDYESRRALWNRDVPSYKSDWNICIMEGVLAPLYVHLLKDQRPNLTDFSRKGEPNEKQTRDCLSQYSRLFISNSSRTGKQLYLDTFHDAVYRILSQQDIDVFPVLRPDDPIPEWHSVSHAFLNDLERQVGKSMQIYANLSTDKPPSAHKRVEEVLLKAGFNLLFSPLRIMDSFRHATIKGDTTKACVKGVKPKDVIEYFKHDKLKSQLQRPLEQTCMVSFSHLDSIMKFCHEYKDFPNELCGLPFLVTSDGMLRMIDNKHPVFLTQYTCLVSNQPERFVHPKQFNYFQSLKVLKNSDTGFKVLTTIELARMLSQDPECNWLMNGKIRYQLQDENEARKRWLHALWQYLSDEADVVLKGKLYHHHTPEDQQILKSLFEPLSDLSIFPVEHHGTTYLWPLKKVTSALDLSSRITGVDEKLKVILKKLQLATPDYTTLHILGYNPTNIIHKLVASPNNVYSLILCLRDHMASQDMAPLKPDEARSLLNYFAENIPILEKDANMARSILQKLPYFETLSHDLISIEERCTYVIPSGIPTTDMDVWKHNQSRIAFLKSYETLNQLHRFLGCMELTDVEIYTTFILEQQHFELMTNLGRMAHLEYIKNSMLPKNIYVKNRKSREHIFEASQVKSNLIEILKGLEFIPDKKGNLHRACEYLHPANEVFRVMNSEEDFPPEPFSTDEWLPFLTTCGLNCNVSQSMFVDYANQIQYKAENGGDYQVLENQSSTLIEHLWSRGDLDAKFLQEVKVIHFIAPSKAGDRLLDIHPQYDWGTLKTPFSKMQGSVIHQGDNMKLAWSAAVMIPDFARQSSKFIAMGDMLKALMQTLEISTQPTQHMILTHLENICERQANLQKMGKNINSAMKVCLKDVLFTIFKHLELIHEELNIVRLRKINCIPVENGATLVKPKQVLLELMSHDEIPPYLYKAPPIIAHFPILCEKLGIPKQATVSHYRDLLKAIHKEVGDDIMSPGELYSSLKALQGLTNLCRRNILPEDNEKELYLPTQNHHLVISSNTILSDDDLLEHRVSELKDINYVISAESLAEIDEEIPIQPSGQTDFMQFLKALPVNCRPALLSDVLEEGIEETFETFELSHISKIARKISQQLQTPEFQKGILRLIRHQIAKENEENNDETEDNEDKNTIKNLAKLDIKGKQKIVTFMTYQGKKVPGSEEEQNTFHTFEKDDEGNVTKCTLFLNNESTKDGLLTDVCKLIDEVTNGCIGSNVFLLKEMFEMDIGRINSYLDGAHIHRLNRSVRNRYPFPKAGNPIPIDNHHLLVQGFHEFKKGEYVGIYYYAVTYIFLYIIMQLSRLN